MSWLVRRSGRRAAAPDFFADLGDCVHKGGTAPSLRGSIRDFLVFLLFCIRVVYILNVFKIFSCCIGLV
jgi:hypothetical protein